LRRHAAKDLIETSLNCRCNFRNSDFSALSQIGLRDFAFWRIAAAQDSWLNFRVHQPLKLS